MAAKLPIGANEMTGVAVWVMFQIVLMLGFGFPKRSCRSDFGDDLAGPYPGGIDFGDDFFRSAFLFVSCVKNGRAIAGSPIVALPVQSGWIVNLEEEFQNLAVADGLRIENNFNSFGVGSVVAIGGVDDVAAGVADAGGNHAGLATNEVLHTPETAAGQDGLFRCCVHVFIFPLVSRDHNHLCA